METRIKLNDTLIDAITRMSGGNPGALTVLIDLAKESSRIDPQSAMGAFSPILLFDSFNIYEERIWMLYKDVCNQDLVKTLACLRACQMGLLDPDELNRAINGETHSIVTDDLLELLKTHLPEFNKD